jgi:peroxiredoxin Q/BCP
MQEIEEKKPAPDFSLADQTNTLRSLKDYHGKWLVLYFYPRDNTPGCTTEACSFRDAREIIAETANAEVVGISKDSVTSHKNFSEQHQLEFTLLSDPNHQVIEAYDSWKPLKFAGRQYLGTQRNTFIIDPDGFIVKKYVGVDPKDHALVIIDDLKSLQAKK